MEKAASAVIRGSNAGIRRPDVGIHSPRQPTREND
jgi:hypothetical protein